MIIEKEWREHIELSKMNVEQILKIQKSMLDLLEINVKIFERIENIEEALQKILNQ